MRQLLARYTLHVLLCNGNLLGWQSILREATRPYRALLSPDDFPCLLFEADVSEPEGVRRQAPPRRWRRALGASLRKDTT